VPTTGVDGVGGCAGIRIFADGNDVQPDSLVTVKLYVPDASPETVLLVPVPVFVMVPGYRVSVHVPVAGKPSSTTLPVDTVHVGGVIVPAEGIEGIAGCGFITTDTDGSDIQVYELVTVKV
jgi:hypothetical protein